MLMSRIGSTKSQGITRRRNFAVCQKCRRACCGTKVGGPVATPVPTAKAFVSCRAHGGEWRVVSWSPQVETWGSDHKVPPGLERVDCAARRANPGGVLSVEHQVLTWGEWELPGRDR